MSDDCFLGIGFMSLSAQQPLLVTGITVLTANPGEVKTKGAVTVFPPCDSDIVTAFQSKTLGTIKLSSTVNVTSADTTATIYLQLITGGGAVLDTSNVNPGTADYTLKAKTYTQPGTTYFVQLVILNSDPTTSVTVNSGSFAVKIKQG